MPVVIEQGLNPRLPLNHARIGYDDHAGTYTATSAAADSPAVAAKSWQTFERWRPTASPATLTKTFDSPQRVDYVGIGAATLSEADSVLVELLLDGAWREIELTKGIDGSETLNLDFADQDYGVWEPIPDNEAFMLLLSPRNGCGGVRVTVEYTGTAPSIGKLAAGEALIMERPFYGGHAPASLAKDITRTPATSQGGEWLGTTIIRSGRSTQMAWQNLSASWVRRNLPGLINHAEKLPFFVAWNPLQFRDCLYASSEGAPQKPSNSGARDLQSWSLDVKAYSDGTDPVVETLVNKEFTDLITFTRASEATYYDAQGILRTAAIDEPRLTHDPETGESLGLLIEEQRTNLLLWSEEFDNAVWGKAGTTVTADAKIAPDGTMTADKIVEDTSDTIHYVGQSVSLSVSTVYSCSVFLKAAERTKVSLVLVDNSSDSGNKSLDIDLAAGTAGGSTYVGGTSSFSSFGIEEFKNGWFRVFGQHTSGTDGTLLTVRAYIINDNNSPTYTGDGTSGIFIWGAQLEAGSFPTSYTGKTEASQATRSVDNASRVLGSEFNPHAFTVLFEYSGYAGGSSSSQRLLSINSGNNNERITITGASLITSQSSQANVTQRPTPPPNGIFAIAFGDGILTIYLNGEEWFSGPRDLSPELFTTLMIGRDPSGQISIAAIRELLIYPLALSAEELETLTALEGN